MIRAKKVPLKKEYAACVTKSVKVSSLPISMKNKKVARGVKQQAQLYPCVVE